MHSRVIGTVAAAALLLPAAQSASAATVLRDYVQSAVSVCQGSLPSFEGALRKRPLAIRNEGDSASFVSCGLFATNSATRIFNSGIVTLWNSGATDQTASCTLVDGFHGDYFPTPVFLPKSIVVPPTTRTSLIWTAADNGGLLYRTMTWNCSLPPGVEIGLVGGYYNEEIGT